MSSSENLVTAVALVIVLLTAGCSAQDTPLRPEFARNMAADGRDGRVATNAAFEAMQAGDEAGFLANMIQADSLRPGHPTLRFHLARAFALNGRGSEAMSVLASLHEAGMRIRMEDDAFAGLRSLPAFVQASQPVEARVHSRVVARGSDPDLQPEGLIRSEEGWLMGSVHQSRILQLAKIVGTDGSHSENTESAGTEWEGAEWASSEWVGTGGYSAMGMERHGTMIWSAQTMTPEGGAPDSLVGQSRVVGYDDESGDIMAVAAPSDSLEHWFGDLTVAPDGTVFISDSRAPGVYRYSDGNLAPLVVGDPFQSPQGVAWMNGQLYVADYSAGIFRVDPDSGEAIWLETPENAVLLGIDGLEPWADGNALLGIQNGTNPTRVVRIDVQDEAIVHVEALDVDHPDHSDPTLGLVENDSLFYVANSQWPLFGAGADASLRRAPIILGLPLRDR